MKGALEFDKRYLLCRGRQMAEILRKAHHIPQEVAEVVDKVSHEALFVARHQLLIVVRESAFVILVCMRIRARVRGCAYIR